MFPVKKVPRSVSYASDNTSRSNRIMLKQLKHTLKKAEEGRVVMSDSFKEELKIKIKELE
jgi:hypothetical protein